MVFQEYLPYQLSRLRDGSSPVTSYFESTDFGKVKSTPNL